MNISIFDFLSCVLFFLIYILSISFTIGYIYLNIHLKYKKIHIKYSQEHILKNVVLLSMNKQIQRHFSNHLLCSIEEKNHTGFKTWGRVNEDRVIFLGELSL